MQKKLTLLFIILFLLPAATIAAGFFTPRVRGNVTVCGVDITGCTEKEARLALCDMIEEYKSRAIVIISKSGKRVLSCTETETRFEKSGDTVKSAPHLRCEVDFSALFSRALSVKKGERADLTLSATYRLRDFPAISAELQQLERVPAQNATMQFHPKEPPYFFFTEEKTGYAVDEYALFMLATEACQALSALPLAGEHTITLSVPYRTLCPDVTVADLKAQTQPLAWYSTDFSRSGTERKHNVCLAAEKLCGRVLGAGERLSFNEQVGARTKERGFLPATVISGGKYEMGVGGGVCQVSSTLYTAALLCGLTVKEWHAHSLAVSYVPPARDAMVSYGTADLVLCNEGETPVYLVAETQGGRLRFTFYGKPSGKRYALVSERVESIAPPPPLIEWDEKGKFPSLCLGEELLLQKEVEGYRAVCYLETTEGGVTTRTLIRKSTYLPMQKHVMLGRANPKEKG